MFKFVETMNDADSCPVFINLDHVIWAKVGVRQPIAGESQQCLFLYVTGQPQPIEVLSPERMQSLIQQLRNVKFSE